MSIEGTRRLQALAVAAVAGVAVAGVSEALGHSNTDRAIVAIVAVLALVPALVAYATNRSEPLRATPPSGQVESLSVVICVHNEGDWVSELAHAAAFSIAELRVQGEVVIVDGESQDGTVDVVRELAGVKLVCAPPGLAVSMRLGVDASSSTHVLICTGEEEIRTWLLAALMSALEMGADIVLARAASYQSPRRGGTTAPMGGTLKLMRRDVYSKVHSERANGELYDRTLFRNARRHGLKIVVVEFPASGPPKATRLILWSWLRAPSVAGRRNARNRRARKGTTGYASS